MILIYVVLAALFALLDVVAICALVVGGLTFVTFEKLQSLRWYLIGGGVIGLLICLPLADHFFRAAIRQLTAV